MSYSRARAEELVAEMGAAAAALRIDEEQHPTKDGHQWACNACPFRTSTVRQALTHVVTKAAGPFEHIVREFPEGDSSRRAARRAVMLDGRPVLQFAPRGSRGKA